MKAVFEKSFAFVLRMSVDMCVGINMISTENQAFPHTNRT